MKAEELMIGDWVKVFDGFKRITQIRNVSNKKEFYSVWCDECGMYESDLEPIPLTAEILEKNGWKDISDHTLKGCETFKLHYEQRAFDFYITIKLRDYFKLESYDDRFYTLCEMEFGCRFIHQLLHALRLCGVDKAIVL